MDPASVSNPRPPVPDPGAPTLGEPVAHFERTPGRVEVRLKDPDALFDRSAPPVYPHTGPMLEKSVAKFLLDAVREQRSRREIEVVFTLASPTRNEEAEATARAQVPRFFANEAELASLDLRVNREDGRGALRYSVPFVVLAFLVAGLFYTQLGSTSGPGFLEALLYLVFITIVWVMLWDPLELLLFDSYFIRLRVRALRKLANARITFVYPNAVRGS